MNVFFSFAGNYDLKSFKGTTLANHSMTYMVATVGKKRHKFTVGYDLTSKVFSPMAAIIRFMEIIRRFYKLGQKIKAIVTDMGGTNQAF